MYGMLVVRDGRPMESSSPLGPRREDVVALGVIICVFVTISLILRPRGIRVVAFANAFVASLVVTQLVMKKLASPPFNFQFPAAVTGLHFCCVWLACVCYWAWVGDLRKCLPASVGSSRRYFATVVPIVICNPISILFNNKAMIYVGAGLCAIVGALSPVTTAVLSRMFGRVLAMMSWAGVLVALCGAFVVSRLELDSMQNEEVASRRQVLYGLSFAFVSLLARGVKIVMMDYLVAPDAYTGTLQHVRREAPLAPMHVYALQAFPSAIFSVALALSTEDLRDAWKWLTYPVGQMILVSCVCGVSCQLLGVLVLRELGASSQQIIGKLNTLCTGALSVALLGETLPISILGGSGVILLGVALFEYGERERGNAADKEEQLKV